MSPSSLFRMAMKYSQGLVYFPSFFLQRIPKLLKSSSKAASGNSSLYLVISASKAAKFFFTYSTLFCKARQQKAAWSSRAIEDLSDWKISLKTFERMRKVSTGRLRKVCRMLVRRISLTDVSRELKRSSFSMYSSKMQGDSWICWAKVPKSQMRDLVDSVQLMAPRYSTMLLLTSWNSLGYFLRIWWKLSIASLARCGLSILQQESRLIRRALLTSGSLKAISVKTLTDLRAISKSTSVAQSLSSFKRSPRLYQLASSPNILTLMLLMQVGSSTLQQKYLKSFQKYCLPFMCKMTYSMCCKTTYMVSQDPEFQLPLINVRRGALIFSTMVLQSSSRFSVNFRMILIEPKTSGVEECFNLSQRIPIISQRSFSLSWSGVQRQRISRMQVCCHQLYYRSRRIKQRYIFILIGIPPSETNISSRARKALTETRGSESLISADRMLMRASSCRMVAGSTQKTFSRPMMAVFLTYGSKSLSSSLITGRTLLTQSADLKEQRFLSANPLIFEEVCLQSFLKVLTAMMARSALSSAQVVRQKQIIFFITSSLVKEALHISEKTAEASMPRVIYPMTFLITSRPFLLSFSLMTLLRALLKTLRTS